MIPFQITFLDFPESDAVWIAVQKRVEKLEHFFDRIVRCEVVVSCPHRHRQVDRLFQIQIRLYIPKEDVIVNHNATKNEAHRNIYVAIRDAFNAAERILQDKIKILRRQVKFHERKTTENLTNVSDIDGHYDIDGVSLEKGVGVVVASDANKKGNLRSILAPVKL